MEVRITKHAFDRFRERCLGDLSRSDMRAVIERMLAQSVNLSGTALRLRRHDPEKEYWIHEATNVIFILDILEAGGTVVEIAVLTVLNASMPSQKKISTAAKRHSKLKVRTWGQRPGRGRPYERQRKVDTDE